MTSWSFLHWSSVVCIQLPYTAGVVNYVREETERQRPIMRQLKLILRQLNSPVLPHVSVSVPGNGTWQTNGGRTVLSKMGSAKRRLHWRPFGWLDCVLLGQRYGRQSVSSATHKPAKKDNLGTILPQNNGLHRFLAPILFFVSRAVAFKLMSNCSFEIVSTFTSIGAPSLLQLATSKCAPVHS